MSKLRSIRTLGVLFALMAYLFSITTLSPAGAEPASVPVDVTASPTLGLVDGQAITVTVTAGSSPIYGVEARQCSSTAGPIDYTSDFSPTVAGKCAATALGSAGADVFKSVTTVAPHSSATLTFKVGKGRNTFALQSGGNATVRCNKTNDCKLTLLLQVTGGPVFKSIPFSWTDSAPGTPGQPSAVAGNTSATVTVVEPTSGDTPVSYTVTSSPGNAQCTVSGASGSCTVNGLTNGTSYTFTSTATNVTGTSLSSVASASVTPVLAPGTPGQPSAVAGNTSATVTVVAPTSGGTPVSYTVTSSPGNAQCTVTGASGSCTVNGLTNGTSYTFTSTATNGAGTSSSSVPSASVTPDLSSGARFNPVTPVRILDTRTTLTPSGVAGRVPEFGTLDLQIRGANGIPIDATAVVMNVTAVAPTGAGYITAYPSGVSRPLAANLNFAPGDVVPNLVTVGIGSNGRVTLYHQGGTIDIVADVVGYYSPVSGDYFTSVTPVRALDTRDGTGAAATRVAEGGVVSLQVAGSNGVPANATGVVINVTAVTPDVAGYVTVYPNGVTRPIAANLNFVPGDIVPNLVIVGIGTQGKVNFYNQNGTLDLVGDIVGYYSPDNTGKQFFPITPIRALDTRDGTGGVSAAVGQGASIDLTIRGANGIPNTASAIVMNTTAVLPTGGSFLTVWPAGVTRPIAASLNYVAGDIRPNLVQVGIGSNGKVSLFNNAGTVNLVADLTGYFA